MSNVAAASCFACRRPLTVAEQLYTEAGDIVCQTCTTRAQVLEGHRKSAGMVRTLAYGNPLLALVSFVVDPFLTLSIGAVGNGLFVLKRLDSDVQRGEHLSRSPAQKIAASIGLVLGVVSLVAKLLR
jgi:hypothetical protein